MAAKTTHVVALTDFYDVGAKVNRKKGEEFDVTAKRLSELNACGVEQGGVPLVEAVKPARTREVEE